MDEFERVLAASSSGLCVDCGKCAAVCPMAEMYPGAGWDLSPRGIVQQALRGRELLESRAVWCCTLCRECARACPAGVDCAALVEGLRPLARAAAGPAADPAGACAGCGGALPPEPVLKYLRDTLPRTGLHYLALCPACRRQAYIRNNS
jgi:ferredoxin